MREPPAEYVAIAKREAQRWGSHYGVPLSPALVLAIMATENARYDPLASYREPDGELSRGLMQVKESTARHLGLSDPALLYNPTIGVSMGAKYLAQQLRRYGNDEQAVAAYNAGSARRSSSGAWVNQGYVDRALAHLAAFRRWLAPAAAGALALFLAAATARWYLSRRGRAA